MRFELLATIAGYTDDQGRAVAIAKKIEKLLRRSGMLGGLVEVRDLHTQGQALLVQVQVLVPNRPTHPGAPPGDDD